ncbi:hypothetical protein PM082_013567 [Marasmius tenuissimus]|nr:hypothetical protein PM082_013567 [Marasmius tenuissimus]
MPQFPRHRSSDGFSFTLFCYFSVPLFEFEFVSKLQAPLPLSVAAKCLALSIKMALGDNLIVSHMYSLLNYIAATSKEIPDSNTLHFNNNPLCNSINRSSILSTETGLGGLSEDKRRLVGITTISVISKLALEFDSEEVHPLLVLTIEDCH